MILIKGQIQYYVDNPTKIYETFSTTSPGTGTWPFDQGGRDVHPDRTWSVGEFWPGIP